MANKLTGLLNSFMSLFGKRDNPGWDFMWREYQREVYPNMDAETAIRSGYLDNDAIFAIINKDVQKFRSIPRYVKDLSTSTKKSAINLFPYIVKEAPKETRGKIRDLQRLLDRPNAYQGQSMFYGYVRTSYKLLGEAMVWLNRGPGIYEVDMKTFKPDDIADKLPVLEMTPLPPQNVIVVSDGTPYGVKEYRFVVNGKTTVLRKNDVIHWKTVNPEFDQAGFTHLRGVNPLQPNRKTKTEYDEIQNSNVRMVKNDGSKGAIFRKSTADMNDRQAAQTKREIDTKINTNDAKGMVATLQGEWGYLNLGASSIDMNLLEARKQVMQMLTFAFDVPFEFWNTETTFANKQMAMLHFITNNIIPSCKELDDEFNSKLLTAFNLVDASGNPTAVIYSDATQLPEIQEAIRQMAATFKDLWMIAPNDILESLGYDRVDNPLFNEPWVPDGRTPLSQFQSDGYNELMNREKQPA